MPSDVPLAPRPAVETLTAKSMKLTRSRTFEGVHSGSFSEDGALLALIDQNYIDIVETASGRKLLHIAVDARFLGAHFSPDGRWLATAHRIAEGAPQSSIKVTVWDVLSGREKLSLPAEDHDWRRVVGDLSFSPDGQSLASNVGGIARLWEINSGKETRRFSPPAQPEGIEAERMLLSPNGKTVAVHFRSAHDPSYSRVHLWDLDTGQQIIFAAEIYLDWRFSKDSKLLALTALADKGKPSERSVAEIWDVKTGKRVKLIEVPREWRGAYTVAFSPDAKLLAIGGYKKFGIFSIETDQLLVGETHGGGGFFKDSESPDQLSHVEFSPDGQLLLTGGNDGTVKLWRINAP